MKKNKYQQFVERMYPLVLNYTSKNNMPKTLADNMMRQMAYESAYGTSALAKSQRNYAGYGRTGKGIYRSYKTDADFVNDYGSYFLRRKDLQNAKNTTQFVRALKRYGYYGGDENTYVKSLNSMRLTNKYMNAYNLNRAKAAINQRINQQLEQPADATRVIQPQYNLNGILLPSDLITANTKMLNIVKPYQQSNPFEDLQGQLIQNLNKLQYTTPQEYMQYTPSYDNGKDFGGYVDVLQSVANKIQNSDYAWRDENGEKLSIDRMLLQMMNDNTYKYKDAYDNHDLIDPSGNMHFSDKYKTVYHPTFSNESIFSGKKSENNPEGIIGGMWSKDGSKYYVGDRVNSMYFNPIRTMQYLKQAEDHPVKLIYRSGIRDTIRAKRLKNHKVFGYDYGKSIPMFDDGSDNNFFGDVVDKLGGLRNV